MAVAPLCHAAPARPAAAGFTGSRPAALAAVALALLFFTCPAAARTWVVRPGGSIQGAIDRAGSGDVILILPGEYREHLSIPRSNLTLRSLAGPASTRLVVPSGSSVGVSFHGTGNVIDGFSITPESADPDTVGVSAAETTLRRCWLEGFAAAQGSGTSAVSVAGTTLDDCRFIDCDIALRGRSVLARGCTFEGCDQGLAANHGSGADGSFTDCVFDGCGVALDVREGTLSLERCQFARSAIAIRGGLAESVLVRHCSFLDVGADVQPAPELPVRLGNGHNEITDSVFVGGRNGMISANDAHIERCTFYNNEMGGAIFIGAGRDTRISDCLFLNNRSEEGGAVTVWLRAPESTVRIDGCVFMGNTATLQGGALRACELGTGELTLEENQFIGNGAPTGAALSMMQSHTRWTVRACRFDSNVATSGHAVAGDAADFEDCRFIHNVAMDGDVLHLRDSQLEDCEFVQNRAALRIVGGAAAMNRCMILGNSSERDLLTINGLITNSTFVGNTGGLVAHSLIGCTHVGNPTAAMRTFGPVIGCIIRNPDPLVIGAVPIRNNDVHISHLPSGPGNIDADPLFVRNPSPGPDQTWGTPDDDYGDLRLQPGSPCIDAADSTAFDDDIATDLDGSPRFVDDPATPDTGIPDPARQRLVADMGAYEFQPDTAPPTPVCDLNADGQVTVHDLLTYLGQWTSADPAADLDGDGQVNVLDLLEFLDCFTTNH